MKRAVSKQHPFTAYLPLRQSSESLVRNAVRMSSSGTAELCLCQQPMARRCGFASITARQAAYAPLRRQLLPLVRQKTYMRTAFARRALPGLAASDR